MPVPRLRGYARETVVAEKFQAMVDLGMANSRMKDYYDLWIISKAFEIDRSRLAGQYPQPLHGGVQRYRMQFRMGYRGRSPRTLSSDTNGRPSSVIWGSTPGPLDGVVGALEAFLMPAAAATREGGG